MKRSLLREGLELLVLSIFYVGMMWAVGRAMAGSWDAGAPLALVGLLLSTLTYRVLQLERESEREVWDLRRRMLLCEEGKLSAAWGARIEERLDQSDRMHDRDIERIESRLP